MCVQNIFYKANPISRHRQLTDTHYRTQTGRPGHHLHTSIRPKLHLWHVLHLCGMHVIRLRIWAGRALHQTGKMYDKWGLLCETKHQQESSPGFGPPENFQMITPAALVPALQPVHACMSARGQSWGLVRNDMWQKNCFYIVSSSTRGISNQVTWVVSKQVTCSTTSCDLICSTTVSVFLPLDCAVQNQHGFWKAQPSGKSTLTTACDLSSSIACDLISGT